MDKVLGKRQQIWRALAAVLAVAFVAACGDVQEANVVRKQLPERTLIRVAEDELSSLDPHKISTINEARVINDLFEGLTDYGPDASIIPGIAQKWFASPDSRTWTFILRPNAQFSDGQPIDANAVVASFRRLMSPETAAPYASIQFAIANAEDVATGKRPAADLGVTALDERTVRFDLSTPTPLYPQVLTHSTAAILPVHAIQKFDDKWLRPENFVGSGPFLLQRWILQDRIELRKNPRYLFASSVNLEKVIYYPISDDNAAVRRFRAGEVDLVHDFPVQQAELLREKLGDQVRIHDYTGSYFLALNTTRAPFNDVRLRRALAMSFDREALAEHVMRIGYRPAYALVPPFIPDYGPEVRPQWSKLTLAQRQAEARHLLAQLGYGPNAPFEFEIRYNSDEMHKRVMLTLAQMWKPLGIRVKLFNSESAVHFNALKTRDFTAARAGWIADFNAPENFLFLAETRTGPLNYSGFSDPAYDALMATAYAQVDPKARTAAFRKAEAYLVEHTPLLTIYYYVSRNLVSHQVEGWVDNVLSEHGSRFMRVTRRQEPAS
jgi:oligopeptide transport system substrate-binding protein